MRGKDLIDNLRSLTKPMEVGVAKNSNNIAAFVMCKPILDLS
jgi:hypothetical protein